MVQIYCHKNTVRLQYVIDFIFENHEIVTDKSLLKPGIVLNYSSEEIPCTLQMIPSELLAEESINLNYPSSYKHSDILSNIFYVLSRYEEYISTKTDHFGRFSASFSEQFNAGQLDQPIVDQWVFELHKMIGIEHKCTYNFIPTFDIDNAWAYKNKGTLRSIASKTKDLVGKDKKRIQERAAVLKGIVQDPYDTYSKIEALKHLKPKVFFLLGDYSKYDRNINWKNKEFQALIRQVSTYAEVGIHPSFDSFGKATQVKKEKERLETIIDKEVTMSRQHFLRFKLPETYQILESIGIQEDYSMGYADQFGWRAGTSKSYNFFDLENNRKSNLKVFPFQYMDGTLNEYLGLDISKAKEVIRQLTEQTQKYGGNFICLWHNETIGNYGIWDGWEKVLNYTISLSDA